MGFVPCLVMTCRVVWKDVWPSDAELVTKLPSFSLCFGAKCKLLTDLMYMRCRASSVSVAVMR